MSIVGGITMNEDNVLHEVCKCGHFGGMSTKEEHETNFQKGHGRCLECECIQFTWVGFHDKNGKELSQKEVKRRRDWELKGEL